MFRTILIELAHTIMGNAHCINEPPNLLPSYRLSYGKNGYIVRYRRFSLLILMFCFISFDILLQ